MAGTKLEQSISFMGWTREYLSCKRKKAATLYKKTRAGISKLVKSSADEMMQQVTDLVRVYTEGFNKMDKRNCFIETSEREDIYAALVDLLNLIPAEFNINKEKLLQVFDELRDF